MTMTVPFVDLAAQQREVAAEIWPRLQAVFSYGHFIGGPDVDDFENAYAAFTGVEHCIGVGNGTDAVEIALRAVGIDRGDEVILPVNTFVATAEAVLRAGGTPVFVDVDPAHLLIDPDAVAAAMTPSTRAIVAVHLYGQVAPIELLAPIADRHGVPIIEDAAQSHGARRFGQMSGSLGTMAATSFYPGKNLGAAGDAGAVMTDDARLARRARMIGAHGSERRYVHEVMGFNSRLDVVQAIVLRAKLARLADWNARRRRIADLYGELLADVDGVELPGVLAGNEHVWHLYVIRVDERARIAATLEAAGIATGIHYPCPLHQSPAIRSRVDIAGAFPVATAASSRILSLPMFPHLTDNQVRRVATVLRAAVRQPERRSEWLDA